MGHKDQQLRMCKELLPSNNTLQSPFLKSPFLIFYFHSGFVNTYWLTAWTCDPNLANKCIPGCDDCIKDEK